MAFETQIAKGVALLDQHYGRSGWLPRIDLETLDMGYPTMTSGCGCIGAQLENSYMRMKEKLGIEGLSGDDYGFAGPEALDREWQHTIRVLRDPRVGGYRGPLELPRSARDARRGLD